MSIFIQTNNQGVSPSIFEKITQSFSLKEDSFLYEIYQRSRIDLRTHDLVCDFSKDHFFFWIQSCSLWGITISSFKFLGVAFGCYVVAANIVFNYINIEFIKKKF